VIGKSTIVVNFEGPSFHRANSQIDELIHELRRSGKDVGQTIAELAAGQQYVKAPKAKLDYVENLLIKPLMRLKRDPSENVRRMASVYLNWLRDSIREQTQRRSTGKRTKSK
jgi:hypothetical protein